VAGVFGRGEGFEARIAELSVAVVPVAGDAAGIIGEIGNALDPQTEVSKVNASLSVLGMATEAGIFAGPVGVAADKAVAVLRLGLRQVDRVAGPLRTLPSQVWGYAKVKAWDPLRDLAEGSLKFAWLAGGDFAARIVREENDLAALNRVVKRYSNDLLDTEFVELLTRVDAVYGDPDAVRGAVRALADFKDASGAVVRLSNEAIEGAVKFMARAGGDLTPAARETLLRKITSLPSEDAEELLSFVHRVPDPLAVRGMRRMLEVSEDICEIVPQ
jgi:hypothetical protein